MSSSIVLTKPVLHNSAGLEGERPHIDASEKMKSSSERAFKIFMASDILLRQYGSGKIIFLYGMSNAGKTSICRAITAINPQIIIDGIDAAMDRHYLKIISNVDSFKQYFSDRYLIISKCVDDKDIPSFLKGLEIEFNPLSTSEERQNAKEAASYVSIIEELFFSAFHRDAAQDNLFENALYLSKNGKNVAIDTVDYKDFFGYKASKSFHCPLLITLIHCSFAKLSEHKDERNKQALATGQEQDTRFGTYPFLQFTDFLKPRESIKEPYMHNVDRETLIQIYDKHLKEELEFRPIPGMREEDIQERRSFELGVLFNRLGLEGDPQEDVQLTPRGVIDMEVDTGVITSAQGASKVLQFI